ncbi:MAG TPA: T9SS type A sorting domain-containing protein [bacterium]|nr:T9SS type A sorting domain-containing protein [bacterium]HPN42001.1 T9SS type A sorting domain-containing protein [bacterium]
MTNSIITIRIATLTFGLALFAMISTTNAQTDIPGANVSGTWTLTNSPYMINGEITIPDSATLTIEPGVNVIFTGHYKFNVQGRLLAVGTEQDSIYFTAQDQAAGWHSIRFINTPVHNDTSKIIYCSLKYGKANTGNDLDRCGGAFSIKNFSKVLISHCLIAYNVNSGNIATTGGGGIALWTASPTISNCEFKANNGVYGSAMAIYYSSNALVYSNLFHDNYGHGTINIGVNSASIFINNIIVNNTATTPAHGIIHFEGGSSKAIFINNTIINNNCGGGGAIWESDGSIPLFINNIICGNIPAQVRLEASAKMNFINCLIEGGREGFKGTAFTGTYQDCLDSNPLFADSTDFHLQDASPCIGAGVDSIEVLTKWYYAPVYDLEGNSRPNPVGSHPDIGAFENPLGSPVTGVVKEPGQLPGKLQLFQNFPNPFNPTTTIQFYLPNRTNVTLKVYDSLGREVGKLINAELPSGNHSVLFEAKDLPSGLYICRLKSGDHIQYQKLLLIR